MPALRPLLPLLLLAGLTAGASLPPGPGGHPGVCPNQLSPNLWVDAQSTCERECVGDQVSTGSAPPSLAVGETSSCMAQGVLGVWLVSAGGAQISPLTQALPARQRGPSHP